MWGKLCLGALCALAVSSAALGRADPPSAPAAYVYDDDAYGRLRISIRFEEVRTRGANQQAAAIQPSASANVVTLDGCPSDGFGVRNFEDLLRTNQSVAIGVKITPPSGDPVQLTPVELKIKKGFGPINFGAKCKLLLSEKQYISPLYNLRDNSSTRFLISALAVKDEHPSPALMQAYNKALQQVLLLVDVPQPVAKVVGDTSYNLLMGSGTNIANGYERQVAFNDPGQTLPMEWSAPLVLGDRLINVIVRANLEVVGSVFYPGAQGLTSVSAGNPNHVLGRQLLANDVSWASSRDVRGVLNTIAQTEYTNYLTATTVDRLNDSCIALESKLNSLGFTATDTALILWALMHRHPSLTYDPAINGKTCLSGQSTTLAEVDVNLVPPPLPPAPGVDATDEQMWGSLNAGGVDRWVGFFTGNRTARRAAAERIFHYPVTVDDPDHVLFPAGTTITAPGDWNDFYVGDNTPLFDKFGCFASAVGSTNEFGGSAVLGLAKTVDTAAGPGREYLVVARFSKVTANKPARIIAIRLVAAPSQAALAIVRPGRGHCGQVPTRWDPLLLTTAP